MDIDNDRLTVRLFGSVQILSARESMRIDRRLPATTLLLTAMLVRRPGEVLRRDEIAYTLWPDSTEDEARANLRRHLYVLQRALPPTAAPWIVCDAKTMSWTAGKRTWVDVNEFERLSAIEEGLECAVDLYAGDFMAHADHPWASNERDRLSTLLCDDLEKLIRERRNRGDMPGALRYIEQLLARDPWREDTLRDLMLSRCSLGDRAGALAIYKRFCQRIQAELGVGPMPETIRCRDAIAAACS